MDAHAAICLMLWDLPRRIPFPLPVMTALDFCARRFGSAMRSSSSVRDIYGLCVVFGIEINEPPRHASGGGAAVRARLRRPRVICTRVTYPA
jgi:hypothetical protein